MSRDGIRMRRKARHWTDEGNFYPYRLSSRLNFISENALTQALEIVHAHVVASTKAHAYYSGLLANSFIYCVRGGEIQGLNSAGMGAQVDATKYATVINFPKYKVSGRVSGFVGTFVSHSMEVGTESQDEYQYASIVEYGGVQYKGEEMIYYRKDGGETVLHDVRIRPHNYFKIGIINAKNDPKLRAIIKEEIVRGLAEDW